MALAELGRPTLQVRALDGASTVDVLREVHDRPAQVRVERVRLAEVDPTRPTNRTKRLLHEVLRERAITREQERESVARGRGSLVELRETLAALRNVRIPSRRPWCPFWAPCTKTRHLARPVSEPHAGVTFATSTISCGEEISSGLAYSIPGMGGGDSTVSDTEADEMEEHLRGLGYLE